MSKKKYNPMQNRISFGKSRGAKWTKDRKLRWYKLFQVQLWYPYIPRHEWPWIFDSFNYANIEITEEDIHGDLQYGKMG